MNKLTYKVRTSISISKHLYDKFKKMALKEGLDFSSALERLMEDAIQRGYIVKVRAEETNSDKLQALSPF